MESKITRSDIQGALKRANAYAELPFPSDMKWLTESIVNEVEKLINEKYSPTPQVQSGLSADEVKLKPTHVKPSYYAFIYEQCQSIARKMGYNLLLHGSMNRDLDMVAVPWIKEFKKPFEVAEAIAAEIGGTINHDDDRMSTPFREVWVINLYRNDDKYKDHQYYLDISFVSLEEYAASKVAEKEREIDRLSGLLKQQHIKNVINIHQDNPERERLANSSWKIYRELHNIQQPDKL